MGRPKKLQAMNVKLTLMLTEQMMAWLTELSAKEQVNQSAMVRALIARQAIAVLGKRPGGR